MQTSNQESPGWEGLEQMVTKLERRAAGSPDSREKMPVEESGAVIELVRQYFIHAAMGMGNAASFSVLVLSHQAALTGWIDRVSVLDPALLEGDEEIRRQAEALTKGLSELLDQLQVLYPTHFSFSHPMPRPQANRWAIRFEAAWAALLTEDLPLWRDAAAVAALNRELQGLLRPEQKAVLTYALSSYLELFLSACRPYRPVTQGSVLSPLLQFTIEFDFNNKGWIGFCAAAIQQALTPFSDPLERWRKVQEYLKSLAQLTFVRTPVNPTLPSLHHQLETWLLAEADFLEKMALPYLRAEPLERSSRKEIAPPVQCTVSVDQLGLFFRAAKDLALIKAPSLKALFDRLAPALATTSRLQLSADSMRTKSYSPEKRDIENVKEVLMQLFKKINTY